MPFIEYQEKRFHKKSLALIEIANQICHEYTSQGYTLTVRQLYYQFVARDHIQNTIKDYKNLASLINDARLAGLIDWEAIEDRTRNLEKLSTWDSPRDILEGCAKQFRFDYWDNQEFVVEIWVEKEALVGVIERIAFKYRCPYFACRGYASQSELWRAGQRFSNYGDMGQKVIVLHLGDHDPSGIDMTRDNTERLELFSNGAALEIIRVALNKDQVLKYNPPPNPAKMTDTRATDYVAKHGRYSWELDALDPRTIDDLISAEIEPYIDQDKWNAAKEREKKAREKLARLAKNWKDE